MGLEDSEGRLTQLYFEALGHLGVFSKWEENGRGHKSQILDNLDAIKNLGTFMEKETSQKLLEDIKITEKKYLESFEDSEGFKEKGRADINNLYIGYMENFAEHLKQESKQYFPRFNPDKLSWLFLGGLLEGWLGYKLHASLSDPTNTPSDEFIVTVGIGAFALLTAGAVIHEYRKHSDKSPLKMNDDAQQLYDDFGARGGKKIYSTLSDSLKKTYQLKKRKGEDLSQFEENLKSFADAINDAKTQQYNSETAVLSSD